MIIYVLSELSAQRSSVRNITFRPQSNKYNRTSLHIPAILLGQKPKDGMSIGSYNQSLLCIVVLTANGTIPVVHIFYNTVHKFLPDTLNS